MSISKKWIKMDGADLVKACKAFRGRIIEADILRQIYWGSDWGQRWAHWIKGICDDISSFSVYMSFLLALQIDLGKVKNRPNLSAEPCSWSMSDWAQIWGMNRRLWEKDHIWDRNCHFRCHLQQRSSYYISAVQKYCLDCDSTIVIKWIMSPVTTSDSSWIGRTFIS